MNAASALVVLCCAGALSVPAAAAETPAPRERHAIGLRLGIRGTSARDDLLVPLTFSGAGPALGATYQGLVGSGTLDARLALGVSVVANRFGHEGLTLAHALAVGYLLPVHGTEAWRFGAGAVLGESSDSLALDSWDDTHGYWLGVCYLGATGSAVGPLSAGWQLEARAELALLGTAGRPEEIRRTKQEPVADLTFYLFHTHANPRFFGPWDVQLFRFDVAARRRSSGAGVGRGWSFGLEGRFAHATFPRTIIVLEGVIYAAWAWGV